MEQNAFLLRSKDYFISPTNTIAIERRNTQSDFSTHYHDFDELVIVSGGSGLHILNGTPYPITCGDLFYINAKDKHCYQAVNNLKLDNILYLPDKLTLFPIACAYLPNKDASQQEKHWQINLTNLNLLNELIHEMALESKKPDLFSIHIAESLFLKLIITLYRVRRKPGESTPTPAHLIDILLTTLHSCIAESFDLNRFCCEHNTSSRTLRRIFKAKTGMTIFGYLQQLRLCKAMSLLRNSAISISLIASECGYEDSNYFSSTFHHKVGVTPSEYRAKHRIS